MSDDLRSLPSSGELTRRQFAVSTLAAGFALAVRPVSAQVIHTDTEGLEAGEVKVPVSDGTVPAYYARPAEGDGPFPTVLVVQEIFGVHEHIKDLCRRLAKLGYCAVATELYARQGDVSNLKDIKDIIAVAHKVPDKQVMSDLDASAAWAKKNAKADTSRMGITGFCWGGRIVWLYAAHNPKLKAGVAWYGRLVGEADPLHPKHPVELAESLNAPVLGLYGAADQSIPLSTIDQMREAAKKAGKTVEIVVYPNTPHAFNADYRPSYHKAEAEDAWKRMLAWFKQNGVA